MTQYLEQIQPSLLLQYSHTRNTKLFTYEMENKTLKTHG